jgi:hypothetical protein
MEIAQLKRMIRRLTRITINMERRQMAAIDDLEAEVARETTVVDSILALVTKLLADIEAAKTDPARIQALVDTVRANDDRLAAAVTANTPAAVP